MLGGRHYLVKLYLLPNICNKKLNGTDLTMWKGKVTPELKMLYKLYMDEHNGMPPDTCEDISYDGMEYEEFVGYIMEALRRHCYVEDIID